MTTTIINRFGKIIGWNNITLRVLGRDVEAITEIAYDDDVKKSNELGAGKYPIGQSEGNYEAKASITLYKEEIFAIQRALPPGTRIQDIPPFSINVMYDYNGTIMKDVLNNVQFMNNGVDAKQGDQKLTTKMDLLISHIDWNAP